MANQSYFYQGGEDMELQSPAPTASRHTPGHWEGSVQPTNHFQTTREGFLAPTSSNPFQTPREGSPAPSSSNQMPRAATASPALTGRPGLGASRATNYPVGDFRNNPTEEINDIKTDVMVNWLYQQQLEKMWTNGGLEEGVILKKTKDEFKCCPEDLRQQRDGFFDAVTKLNVRCAMTVNTRVVKLFLRRQDIAYVPLENGLRLQILPDVSYLPQCQKHHFGAFIQDASILIVWDDDPHKLLARVQNIETQFMNMIWKEQDEDDEKSNFGGGSKAPSIYIRELDQTSGEFDEKIVEPPRRTVLIQPIITAITMVLVIGALGTGWRHMAIEIKIDHKWVRLAFLVLALPQIWLALFFMQIIATCIAQLLGPISQMNENSKYFSGIAPPRYFSPTLPHVTIQCPVYKEGLWSVIDPTVKSIKAAISTYEMQGGSANIFINDDGMQIISAEEAQERREYYDEHNIGWVARPKHSTNPTDGSAPFIRAGKFKKASNMNYALSVSARIEDKLATIHRPSTWTQVDERRVYQNALSQVVESDNGRTWADGNVRIGDYILLIDSDTRVPVDCFMDAVREMEMSPQVAIIQFSSGVMNVTTSWFEKGITFFTHLIYTAIEFATANGDVAPFVGHNAFLRWTAVQDIGYTAKDGTEKYWSEDTVSEDFDMALRLQICGYVIRLAAYADGGFKEGVSLTVYDELARWEKYAYGCSELIFQPFRYWLFRGPFTKLFLTFITSNMPLHSKVTILAYIGTYYAIGSSWVLTLANYMLVGWLPTYLDHYYIDSFKVYFAIVMVFSALGNVALAVLRYRIEERSLFGSLWENFKWLPLVTIFLGGISLHVSQAITCHLLSIDMSWGATSKEATDTSFFKEIPTILKKFKFTFIWCFLITTMLIVFAGVGPVGKLIPYDYQIDFFTAIYPMAVIVVAHFFLPLILNPGLMQFTF